MVLPAACPATLYVLGSSTAAVPDASDESCDVPAADSKHPTGPYEKHAACAGDVVTYGFSDPCGKHEVGASHAFARRPTDSCGKHAVRCNHARNGATDVACRKCAIGGCNANESSPAREWRNRSVRGRYGIAATMPVPMSPEVAPILMPHFDGKRAEFRSFWQLFEEAVHTQAGVSSAYKMMYLRSLLKGEPEELVRAFGVDGTYYEAAVVSLKEKYGDQARLLNELHAEFDRIPAATDSVKSARSTFTRIEIVCRQMEAAGQSPENPHVAYKIERLMPEWVLEAVLQEKASSALWTVKMLLNAIARTIGLREAAASLSGRHQQTSRMEMDDEATDESETPSDEEASDKGEPSQWSKSSWTSRIDDETAQQAKNVLPRKHPCKLCEGNHIESDCKAYPSVRERKERIKQQNRCLRCLREGHRAVHCRSTGRCFFCYAKHHSSLCEKHISDIADQEGSGSDDDNQSQEDDGSEADNDFEEDEDEETEDEDAESQADEVTREVRMYVTLTSAATEVAGSVPQKSRLLTRKVMAKNPLEGEHATAGTVIICDGGADASFVSKQLVEKLQLLPVHSENLVIRTMTATVRMPDCKVYDVDIRMSDGSYMRVRAYESSRPIGALRSLHVEQEGDTTQGCEWSVAEETTYPEVIVGADFVYQLDIRQEANQGSNCILLQSKVGPMAVPFGRAIPSVFSTGSGKDASERSSRSGAKGSNDVDGAFAKPKREASNDPVYAHDDEWQRHRFLTHAVQVKSARCSKAVRVNAVFNSEIGSSFITKSLVKALQLVPAGARKVKWISREGESYSSYAEYYRVSVLGVYGELIDVEVHEKCSLGPSVPTIAYEPVDQGNVLSGCRAVPKSVTAMMLIGADNYEAFCVARIADLEMNVTLYKSEVGYMCSTARHEAVGSTRKRNPLEDSQDAAAKRGRYDVQ
ncbi:gag protein [Aphelenchoides avenae]|nr:gag protein [Aphelenchus avenae]